MDTNMKLMVNMTEAIRRELQNIVELWKETKGGHLAVSSQLCVCVPLVVTGIRLDCTFDSVFLFEQGARRLISHPCQRSYGNQLEESWDANSCTCILTFKFL